MTKRPRSKNPDLILGPLPCEIINRVLGYELDEGEVVLSGGAQVHANRQHPEDYPLLQPHVASIVTAPLYVGDDLRNHGKIELVGRVRSIQAVVLVAVNIEADANGNYQVMSFYKISEAKVENRRQKGHLKSAF